MGNWPRRPAFALALAGLLAQAGLAVAAVDAPRWAPVARTLAPSDPPIRVFNDNGGVVARYALEVYTLMQTRQEVKFIGRCESACTLLLSLPASQTCVASGATFRFHAPSAPVQLAADKIKVYMLNKYPRWVQAWIENKGGLTTEPLTMDAATAQRFLRTCD